MQKTRMDDLDEAIDQGLREAIALGLMKKNEDDTFSITCVAMPDRVAAEGLRTPR